MNAVYKVGYYTLISIVCMLIGMQILCSSGNYVEVYDGLNQEKLVKFNNQVYKLIQE